MREGDISITLCFPAPDFRVSELWSFVGKRGLLISQGCCSRVPNGVAGSNRGLLSHNPKARNPKSSCWQGHSPSDSSWGGSFLISSHSGVFQQSLAWTHSLFFPVSSHWLPSVRLSLCSHFPSCKDSKPIGLGPTLVPSCSLITSVKTLTAHVLRPWDGTSTCLWSTQFSACTGTHFPVPLELV